MNRKCSLCGFTAKYLCECDLAEVYCSYHVSLHLVEKALNRLEDIKGNFFNAVVLIFQEMDDKIGKILKELNYEKTRINNLKEQIFQNAEYPIDLEKYHSRRIDCELINNTNKLTFGYLEKKIFDYLKKTSESENHFKVKSISNAKIFLENHKSWVNQITFNPSSELISWSSDNTIKAWNTSTQKVICSTSKKNITAFCIIKNCLVIGFANGKLRKFLFENGNFKKVQTKTRENVNLTKIISITGSSNPIKLFTVSEDKAVRIWDFQSLSFVDQFPIQNEPISSITISPNSEFLVIASKNKTQIWNTEEKKIKYNDNGHDSDIITTAFARNGEFIVSGSWDKSLKIWDFKGTKECSYLMTKLYRIISIAISENCEIIATGIWEKKVLIWNVNERRQEIVLDTNYPVYSVAISPDSKKLAYGGHSETVTIETLENN